LLTQRVAVTAERSDGGCESLFEGDAHGLKLLGCGICGGIFLDNDGCTRITRAHDSVIANLAERAKVRAVATSVDTRARASCTRTHLRADTPAAKGDPRAEAEARMAAFREMLIGAIERAEKTSTVGAFGVTLGVLGVLAALVGASDS
jgi:hypothetical protein